MRIAALVTVIIAVAVFPVSFMAYKEFYVKPFILSFPRYMRPFVDADPFPSTVYWDFTKLIWITLGAFWLAVVAIRVLKLKLGLNQ